MALSRCTYCLAFRARIFLAHIFRTTNRALGLFAVYSAFCTFGLLTLHLAFRTRTNGMTDGGARRIIALPATSGMAIGFLALFAIHFCVDFSVYGYSRDNEHA